MNKLIVLSGGATTQGLIPLLLKKEFDLAIIEPQIAEANKQKYGDRIVSPLGQVPPEFPQNAYNEATKLWAGFAEEFPISQETIQRSPEWQGFADKNIVDFTTKWLPGFTHQSFNNQILRMFVLDNLYEKRKPVLCITHEDVTEVFGGLARWAQAREIPTMHIPHGNCYALPEIAPDIHFTSICDYIAATPFQEKFYRLHGYQGEIKLTGSPLFEHWSNYNKDKDWACRAMKLDASKPIICYFSSWGQMTNAHDSQTRFEETLREVLLAGFEQLIIKLHPGEPQGIEQSYCKMAQDYGARTIVTRLYYEPILSAADSVVTLGASNFLVDAACMDVPGIAVRMPGYSIQHPAMPECEPSEILTVANEQLQASTKFMGLQKEFLNEMRYSDRASENIVSWIEEILA